MELSYKWTNQSNDEGAGTNDKEQYVLPDTLGVSYKVTVTVKEKGYSGEAVSELSPEATKIAIGGFVDILVSDTDEKATSENTRPGATLKADISGMIPKGIQESDLQYLWFSGTGDKEVPDLKLLNRGKLREATYTLTDEEVGRTIHLMVNGAGELYQGFVLSEGTSIGAQQGYTGTEEAATEEAVPNIETEDVIPAILKKGQPVTANTPIYPGDELTWDEGTGKIRS